MNCAGIGPREEGEIQQRKEEQAHDDNAREHEQNRHRALQHHADHAVVEIQEAFEFRIEPRVEAVEQRRAGAPARVPRVRCPPDEARAE